MFDSTEFNEFEIKKNIQKDQQILLTGKYFIFCISLSRLTTP